MIVGFSGGLGSGKTIGMVRYLFKDHANGNKVFANFGLRNIDFEYLNVPEIMNDSTLNSMSVGIDEITVFLDCRKSSSKMNRYISYFILQTRKRNVNLYYTTQDFGMVDLRLINHTHFQILCNDTSEEYIKKYTIMDFRNPQKPRLKRFFLDISKYFDYYDTNEVILPPVLS